MKSTINLFAIVFNFVIILNGFSQTNDLGRDTLFLKEWEFDFIKNHDLGYSIKLTNSTYDTIISIDGFKYRSDSLDSLYFLVRYQIKSIQGSTVIVLAGTGVALMVFQDKGEGYIGLYKEFFENGKLKTIGQYCYNHPGKKTGIWKQYNTSGTLVKQKVYKKSKCC